MMGGMGGMPMGGPMGGAGGAARPDMPQPRRDRASERILTGEEARDKALVSHILRDDDPPAGSTSMPTSSRTCCPTNAGRFSRPSMNRRWFPVRW
uniref:hypothetical protein n=1 Tax=Mycolicibacterium fortuitum TaxID=1766 RepID=UPI0018664551|nr:hypothetical protein [Mycolicibacterium fortuitum]